MYPISLLAHGIEDVKSNIMAEFEAGLDEILGRALSGAAQRDLEEHVWDVMLPVSRLTMSNALSLQCRQATEADISARGLTEDQFRLRNEPDYWMTITTTFGPVSFFSFAYRDSSSGVATVTKTPARGLDHAGSRITRGGQRLRFRLRQRFRSLPPPQP